MPTYVCSVAKGSVNDGQKSAIAKSIGRIHSEETGAPTYYVQVVIEEKEPSQRFLGGELETKHVWIRADIREGRTEAQRRALMLRITDEISAIIGVTKHDVWVYLNNLAPGDMVEYGHVLPQPGQEVEWFDGLPKSLQDYLKRRGQ